jgi:hypothetical protein
MKTTEIVDDILLEWALRSHDGLVSGHDTPENMSALHEILVEKRMMSPNEKQMSFGLAANTSAFTPAALIKEKSFNPAVASAIVEKATSIFDQKTYAEFIDRYYDKLSPDEAIDFVNRNYNSSTYGKFIQALDDSSMRREMVKTQVGRGEFILATLIKGCKTTGQKSGDLELSDGSVIDVKELNPKDSTFRVSLTVFDRGFSKLKFPRAMNELFAYCRSNPDAVEILTNMVDEAGVKDSGGSKYNKYTKRLFTDMDWNAVVSTAVSGLLDLTIYLHKMSVDDLEKAGLKDRAEFDLGADKQIMAIDKISPDAKEKILNPDAESVPVTLNVSAISDKKNDVILPEIKKLEIFKKPTSEEAAFTPRTIADDMMSSMKHYSAGIIFYQQGKSTPFYYEPDLSNMKQPFIFYLYAQNAVAFKRI